MGNACTSGASRDDRPEVAFIGLPKAGKTTLLRAMCTKDGVESGSGAQGDIADGAVCNTVHFSYDPTGATKASKAKSAGKTQVSVYDVNGNNKHRARWTQEYARASVLVFVVDGFDRLSHVKARDTLHGILSDESLSADTRLCLFLNKSDKAGAMTQEGCLRQFELGLLNERRTTVVKSSTGNALGPKREWHVIEGSATRGDGVEELLKWLCSPPLVGHSISRRVDEGSHKPQASASKKPLVQRYGKRVSHNGVEYDLRLPPKEAGLSTSAARAHVAGDADYLGGTPASVAGTAAPAAAAAAAAAAAGPRTRAARVHPQDAAVGAPEGAESVSMDGDDVAAASAVASPAAASAPTDSPAAVAGTA